MLLWGFLFVMYNIIILTNGKNKIEKNKKHIISIVTIIYIILIILIFVTPIYFNINENGITVNLYGLSQTIFSISFMGCGIIILLLLLLNIKYISAKKYIPTLTFLILLMFVGIIQILFPKMLLMSFFITIVTSLMYHTIENPDMKMIEKLNMAKDQADKANRAKSDFLSSMSHEIRTPLNAIVGFSEAVKMSKSLDEAVENADDIINASQTLLEIVNGILDISKIESGKLEIVNSNYNAKELFTNVSKLIQYKLDEKALEFKVNIAEDLPHTLYGDYANIKKIVTNLLSNAAKYTDSGYVKYDVNCIIKDNICRLIISVEDSGRGIKEEQMDKLFTRFQRLDEDKNSTIEGTGLGLAITKHLVEKMNGDIVVQSKYGKGSKFTVTIDQRISLENVENAYSSNNDNKEINIKDKKILVVDDNILNLKVAKKTLEKYTTNVELVESGFICLDKLKENKYDLILLDDMMPKMSGKETLVKIKQLGINTPVVALTANAISGEREKYINLGFNEYLSKPIDKKELEIVLGKIFYDNTNTLNNQTHFRDISIEEIENMKDVINVVEE
jgi:signal transduction histidine kinase/ActR/RegA family two-component response regulator